MAAEDPTNVARQESQEASHEGSRQKMSREPLQSCKNLHSKALFRAIFLIDTLVTTIHVIQEKLMQTVVNDGNTCHCP